MDSITPAWTRNTGDERAAHNGCRFDVLRGAWAVFWIERYCRLYEGEGYAGNPVILHGCLDCDHSDFHAVQDWDEDGQAVHIERARLFAECVANGHHIDWQYEAFMRLFGWVKPSEKWKREVRRFKQGSFFMPKKSKKSPSLAALGMYLLAGDGEPGQKVYLAAKDGDQAKKNAAKHTVEMWRQSDELMSEITLNMTTTTLTHEPSRSVMYPLSSSNSRTQKSKEGLNGSVLVDECFIAGTSISTPNGVIPIDEVRPGMLVCNAIGSGIVQATTRKQTSHICHLEYSDGTQVFCTSNHPVFTGRGWVKAGELVVGEVAYRQQDLQELWQRVSSASLEEQSRKDLRTDGEILECAGVLLDILREEIEESDVQRKDREEGVGFAKENRPQAYDSWRKRHASAGVSRGVTRGIGGWVDAGGCNSYGRAAKEQNSSNLLQSGYRKYGIENCHRGGREVARYDEGARTRQKEDGFSSLARLVNVSRVELESPVTVFNLHVSGHPSYFASGILVHNCHVVDREFINIISRAGISRSEALHCEFSTAGNNPDSYGKERFDYSQDVLSGKRVDEELLALVYAAPQDVTDDQLDKDFEHYARLANPSYGHTIDPVEIRTDYDRSKVSLESLGLFKMYRLNIWQHSSNPWLRPSAWAAGAAKFSEADLLGQSCVAGLDLALKWDMSALVLMFANGELDEMPKYRILPYLFLPEITARSMPDLPWRSWHEAGFLTLTSGDTTDFPLIRRKINELRERFDLVQLGYDSRFAASFAQELQDEDGLSVHPINQSPAMFSEPIQSFESDIVGGRLEHPNNECLNWQAGNATLGRNGMLHKPDGKSGTKKIDGIVAAVMARAQAAFIDSQNYWSPADGVSI